MPETIRGFTAQEGDLSYLGAILAAGASDSCKIGLYLASWNPSRLAKFADLVANEAQFDGYARKATTFSPQSVDQVGTARSISANEIYVAGAGLEPESLGGAFLTLEDVGPPVVNKLLAFYPFPLPLSVNQVSQSVGVKVVITAPDLSGYAILES